jgi:hypothetical protein
MFIPSSLSKDDRQHGILGGRRSRGKSSNTIFEITLIIAPLAFGRQDASSSRDGGRRIRSAHTKNHGRKALIPTPREILKFPFGRPDELG